MKEVQEEVKEWLLNQQDWLQEAADRLLSSGKLQDEDVEAVTELLKTADGCKVTKQRTFASLTQASAESGELRLMGISEVQGIENLSPKSPLNFGNGNLVVVYGHNGSGKSGYTRILKRVSGKPRAAALKANVFGKPPQARHCKIDYQQGPVSVSLVWPANSDPVQALRAVDVFDSDEAVHYLTKESTAGYVPPLVSMFEQLAAACDGIKAKLQTQQDKLVSGLPALPQEYAGTGPAGQYKQLRHTMSQEEIAQLTSWTDAQAATLHDLTERLKVDDPSAVATQRRAKKAQVEKIITALVQGIAAFGAAGVQSTRALHTVAKDKRQIAAEAAEVNSALLDGVGQANLLLTRLQAAKKAGEVGGGEAYRALAQGICSDFRKLLERTVEDDLLNEVVKRHRRSVTTENRLSALSAIEITDCATIDRLMTKYSFYEHSQSMEVPAFIPDEPELRADIESLKAWRDEFEGRCKKALA